MLMFLMRINFNGFWGNKKGYGTRYATTAGNMWWQEKYFAKLEVNELHFVKFLKSCIITCEPYEDTIKWANKGVWMYADPPYRLSHENYRAAGSFDDENQLELVQFMKDCHRLGAHCAESNREHHDGSRIHWEMAPSGRKHTEGGWFGDKFDDNWTMHMFTGHKYTSARVDKEGALATEILIKNY